MYIYSDVNQLKVDLCGAVSFLVTYTHHILYRTWSNHDCFYICSDLYLLSICVFIVNFLMLQYLSLTCMLHIVGLQDQRVANFHEEDRQQTERLNSLNTYTEHEFNEDAELSLQWQARNARYSCAVDLTRE